jgi:putative glycosyltransferase (TIGR04348 family)
VTIISPALAKANNGNSHTAERWGAILARDHKVELLTADRATLSIAGQAAPDLVIALHALKSADALQQCAQHWPLVPRILILTGTDLYRDIHHVAPAQDSLALATRLVVLQEAGLAELAPALRCKACVIHQSAKALKARARSPRARSFEVIMIGHLREEKDPVTYLRAAALLTAATIHLTHIGGALELALGELASATERRIGRYRWLGNLPHHETRQHLKRSDLMVICSKMEGGANVIIEAITSGVPVLASDISGNRGMLGDDYAGYFPQGDAPALAALIERAAGDADFYQRLEQQCAHRAALFTPAAEQAAVLELVRQCLDHVVPSTVQSMPGQRTPS